ncbi:DHH family phosphoesterase [Halobacteria archaeon AArc-m2/3/4]|uniref:DHH family phosphoesterase n=1 Tax=Natronoglomus mannanivorans TaxID=2979990 RepID=A0AAP2Z0E5_9EURY|nr:DHH family phosphoesterase [Halobacteria archaeon AArc-xg1-1]MCU4974584.1 DHH family phosphoesterase [Halobacteria archaeon AArc-m2/3/4]
MVSRLVLGCGSVGQRIVEQLPERDGSLLVVAENADIVETLRDDNVPAQQGDPTDPNAFGDVDEPMVVLVAGDRTDRNRLTLERAHEQFPNAVLVVYAGGNFTGENRAVIEELADRIVDPTQSLADRILEESTSAEASKALALRRQLSTIEGTLAVVMHDNPDPDAIASAVALTDLAAAVDVEAQACYFGEISHQENRAMVNLLDLDLRNLSSEDSLGEYSAFALVDHSRPGVNDQLPPELHVDIVIDHHPPRGPVPGEFVDLRENAGATSTVMTEYIERFGLDFPRRTATALLYGIRVDTNDFTREVSAIDFRAAATLLPAVDQSVLEQVEEPTVEGETLETIARAIKKRTQRGTVVVSSAGYITDRDSLPQAAEQLLNMEGVNTTLVYGFIDEMVFLSARSRASEIDLGETLRDAFDQIGSAGGHADMAGAQLEVGSLGGVDDQEQVDSILSVVEEVITDRFFEAIRTRPGTPVGAYSQASEWLFMANETVAEGESEGGVKDGRGGDED